MKTRTLGNTGISVSPIMLGCNVFGWTIDEQTSFRILDAFVDHGFNFIDTADVYSAWVPGNKGGESETILGNWFARSGKRDKVVLATKVGMPMGEKKGGLKPSYIRSEVEASLQRLQTDRIDLYQSHKDDPETPQEDVLKAYDDLIREGKIRTIGASNFSGARFAEALEISKKENLPSYITMQPEYNLYDRKEYETDLAPVIAKYDVGVVTYFSLASGFLTGKYQNKDAAKGANRESRVEKYFDERGLKILKALAEVEKETGASQAAISLAWLMAQPHILAPIASATSTNQLQALFAAPEVHLNAEQVKKLNDASAY